MEGDEELDEESKSGGEASRAGASVAIGRMECIYFKLWAALRWAVRVAFLSHEDVLEAGSDVQVCCGWFFCLSSSNMLFLLDSSAWNHGRGHPS